MFWNVIKNIVATEAAVLLAIYTVLVIVVLIADIVLMVKVAKKIKQVRKNGWAYKRPTWNELPIKVVVRYYDEDAEYEKPYGKAEENAQKRGAYKQDKNGNWRDEHGRFVKVNK